MEAIEHSLGFDPKIFVVQVVLFIALWTVMNVLFWKPVLAHLKGRKDSISDAYQSVEHTRHEMETLRAEYQARLAQIEAEARAHIQSAIKDAQAERERVVSEARAQSDALLRESIAGMEREKTEALQSLREQMIGMALTSAGKALGPAADSASLRRSVEENIAQSSNGGLTTAVI